MVQAQIPTPFSLTFEDTTVINQVFYTDSILDPQGIWQIGPPHKSFMNTALSPPNGVVTLLDSLLPPGSMGSFIITIPGLQVGGYGASYALTFAHRFQFDSARGGGYVQFSVDSGRIWHNIFISDVPGFPDPPCVYARAILLDSQMITPPTWGRSLPTDTTAAIPYFTGTDSVWMYDTIILPQNILPDKTNLLTPYIFRFTAYTDSSSSPVGGWLLDNINFVLYGHCEGGINELNSSHLRVYPDPVTDAFTVSMLNEAASDYQVSVFDLTGRAVADWRFTGTQALIQRGGLDAGTYFIQVTDLRTQNTFQQRMVFE